MNDDYGATNTENDTLIMIASDELRGTDPCMRVQLSVTYPKHESDKHGLYYFQTILRTNFQ